VPGDVDGEAVVTTTHHNGLYTAHTGAEIHDRFTFLQLQNGERIRVGVGSTVHSFVLPESNPVVYPDAEVSNLWVQTEQPVATWVADVTSAAQTNPDALNTFIDAVVAAGAETGMVRIHDVPTMGFYEDTLGPFPAWLAQQHRPGMAPDMLSDLGGHRQTAVLSYFDAEGRLVEGIVVDLGLKLKAEEPCETAFDGFAEPFYPVALVGSGPLAIAAAAAGDLTRPVQLRIYLHSDIWFPWINGALHPLCDYKRKFDNRLLAELNAPKLNVFLSAVADAAMEAGGSFSLDRDETNVRPEYVTDHGIVLDPPPPAAQFTEEDRNASWDEDHW
jgi:hypothetical protein